MLDAEALAQERLELAPAAVAVISGGDHHMSGERRKSGGHLPDVEVVDLDDAGLRGERSADLVGVDAAWRGLEQAPIVGPGPRRLLLVAPERRQSVKLLDVS